MQDPVTRDLGGIRRYVMLWTPLGATQTHTQARVQFQNPSKPSLEPGQTHPWRPTPGQARFL